MKKNEPGCESSSSNICEIHIAVNDPLQDKRNIQNAKDLLHGL